jgi:hypothetical protein
MRNINMLAAVAAMLLSGVAVAKEKPAETPKEKKICKVTEASTTSRIPGKRVCRTAAEWAKVDEPEKLDSVDRLGGMSRGNR